MFVSAYQPGSSMLHTSVNHFKFLVCSRSILIFATETFIEMFSHFIMPTTYERKFSVLEKTMSNRLFLLRSLHHMATLFLFLGYCISPSFYVIFSSPISCVIYICQYLECNFCTTHFPLVL
jgi:hypothetical protein